MKRRTFIGAVVGGVTVVGVGAWRLLDWLRQRDVADLDDPDGDHAHATPATPVQHARFPERYRTALRAMTERIMPDENEAPGAKAADAWEFIDRELAGPEMTGTHRLLMRGAAQLDKVSMEVNGTTFIAATAGAKDTVIQAMQKGVGAVKLFDPVVFVSTMVGLTLEGMFSDPSWGGNRDGVGWQLIGYAMHPPRPGAAYEAPQ